MKGYKLHKFSKLPYLCRGDMVKKYYVLYDAVIILSRPADRQLPALAISNNKKIIKYGPHNCAQCAKAAAAKVKIVANGIFIYVCSLLHMFIMC